MKMTKPNDADFAMAFELADALIGFLSGAGTPSDIRNARVARQIGLTPH